MTPHSMLKERWIQIFIESILECHSAWHKANFVSEFNFGSGYQRFPSFRCQFYVDNAVAIVADFEFLVRENVRLLLTPIAPNIAHTSPYRQTVDVHLIPVIIFHSIRERLHLLFVQFNHANLKRRDVICKPKYRKLESLRQCRHIVYSNLTFKIHRISTEFQFDTLQCIAERFVLMTDALFISLAKTWDWIKQRNQFENNFKVRKPEIL